MSKDATSIENKIVTMIIDIPHAKELDIGIGGITLKPMHPLSSEFCIVIQNRKELDELLEKLATRINKGTLKELVEKYDSFINGVRDNKIIYEITACPSMPMYSNSYSYKIRVFKGELITYNMSNYMGYVKEGIELGHISYSNCGTMVKSINVNIGMPSNGSSGY